MLTIAAPETLCAYRLPPAILRFRAQFPEVNIRVLPTPEGREAWQRLLRNGEIEAAMRIGAVFDSAEFDRLTLNSEPLYLLTHPNHELAQKSLITPHDLVNQTLLLTEPTCTYRVIFEQLMRARGVQPETIIEFHAVEAIKQCAIAGLGIAVLPALTVADALNDGRLTALHWQDPVLQAAHQVTTQILYPKRAPSANLKALLRILNTKDV